MKHSLLISIARTVDNFKFSPTKISNGLYLVDANDYEKDVKIIDNVCLVVVPSMLPKISSSIIGGNANLIAHVGIFFDYMFIKSSLTCTASQIYEIQFNPQTKKISFINDEEFAKKDTDIMTYDSCHWFGFPVGSSFEKEALKNIKKYQKFFPKYKYLYQARLLHTDRPPLYIAANLIDSAFMNNQWDQTRFILVVSILETLFTTNSNELTFRLSSNISRFLYPNDRDYKKRVDVIAKIKKIYALRSRTVHGSDPEIKYEKYVELHEVFTQTIQKIIENPSIRKFFIDKKKHKKFIQHLEVGHFLTK